MKRSLLNLKKAVWFNLISETQPKNRLGRIPGWVWGMLVGLVIIVAIIVTLREDEEVSLERPEARLSPPNPEPVPQSFVPAPALVTKPVESTLIVPSEAVTATPSVRPDNLKRIKGIGPKIEILLNDHGITTFPQIAAMKPHDIQTLLDTVDWTDLADPTTWPEQARELAVATGSNS
ncbi:MAG: hypothetical protein KDI79_10695 [Anaerolineae bacterium]|nr:hypothetical protein [Anaerolineae bacterium]